MKNREYIQTDRAPSAIGAYSQAVKCGQTVWISGQIPLRPTSMEIMGNTDSDEGVKLQVSQTFENLKCICEESGGSLNEIVKLNIFLTDMSHFNFVNEKGSTFRARFRYWEIWPPNYFIRWLPKEILFPPNNLDAIVALILLEDFLTFSLNWPEKVDIKIWL